MMGYDRGLREWQTPDQLRAATNQLAWGMYDRGDWGGVRHLINDWVHGLWGDKLNSMEWYNASVFNQALHAIVIDLNQ